MPMIIAPPPPEVVTQLSELITLVLNAKAASKTIEDLKAASEEYHAAKLDSEVALSKINLAQQELDSQKEQLEPLIKQSLFEKEQASQAIANLAQARADLQAGFANLESRQAEVEEREKEAARQLGERQAELDRLILEARDNAKESEAMKEKLATKLALLQEA